jgi:hypothetical protein
MTMTKGERAELRAAVRLQFKVLRTEVAQRRAEILADLATEIDAEYTAHKKIEEDVQFQVNQAVLECNRKINDILYEHELQARGDSEAVFVRLMQPVTFAGPDRQRKTIVADAKLNVQVREALTALDRQEADMLRKLTLDALEGDEARAFFESIPTVSALVPVTRLIELERAMEDDD